MSVAGKTDLVTIALAIVAIIVSLASLWSNGKSAKNASSQADAAHSTSEQANRLATTAIDESVIANRLAKEANETSEKASAAAKELAEKHHAANLDFDVARAKIADNALALDLYRDLTDLDTQAALLRHGDDEASRRLLVAKYDRAAATFELLNKFENIEDHLRDILDRQLDVLRAVDPEATRKSAAVIEAKRAMDRSTYSWDGSGKFTKHQILQKIALQLMADHHANSVATVATALGSAVQGAVGDKSRTFSPNQLLTLAEDANSHHVRVAEKVGWLDLDGDKWVVTHSLGYPAADYAVKTQIPVINDFIKHGYHVERST